MNVCKVASRIRLLRLEDRLADIAFSRISASLYCAYTVNITAFLEDMEDFFTNTT